MKPDLEITRLSELKEGEYFVPVEDKDFYGYLYKVIRCGEAHTFCEMPSGNRNFYNSKMWVIKKEKDETEEKK